MSSESKFRTTPILSVFLVLALLAASGLGYLWYQSSQDAGDLEQEVASLKENAQEQRSRIDELETANQNLSIANWAYRIRTSNTQACAGDGGNMHAGSLAEVISVQVTGDGHINLWLHYVSRNPATDELETRSSVVQSYAPPERSAAVSKYKELCDRLSG